ncbi:hypothetical protein NUW58_g10487 [Xylaria curta]|uniref:Uncharacterized protein n=1 Tax=Xylaria curta TaxID=42375 RepID=A0ACC1MJW9_9PEZI|nr:hypothetical protein NUW58_g10487 [Xylaria curta]
MDRRGCAAWPAGLAKEGYKEEIRLVLGPELDRSPTLPCAQMTQERDFANGPPRKSFEGRKSGCAENTHRPREFEAEVDADLRFPIYQPLQQRERGSLDGPRLVHARTIDPGPQRVSVPGAVPPNPQRRNNPAIDATRQLAGQARVPCVDVGASGQRYSRPRQSNTDAELQAILRRTAERLQDGSRSARRQTLMLPPSAPSGLPGPTRRGLSQEGGFGNDHSRLSGMAPSPARSQKSAPAAVPCSELEGCSPRAQQGPSQNGPPWQTHRRTHTRQISHVSQVSQVSHVSHVSQVSQVSQVSRLSEPDSLVAAPSRTGSQSDALHTALSSPSRTVNTSPSFVRSYSPVSEQSSALSTVYSEEEDSPPISVLKLDHASKRGYEMERSAMTQASRVPDAFGSGQMRVNGDAEIGARRRELKTKPHIDHGPHSLHKRKTTSS